MDRKKYLPSCVKIYEVHLLHVSRSAKFPQKTHIFKCSESDNFGQLTRFFH